MLFKRIAPFLFLLILLSIFLVHSSSNCQQTSSPSNKQSPPTHPPFCTDFKPKAPLASLQQNGLLLDCKHLIPQTGPGTDDPLVTKRIEIANRYDEIRSRFLKIRNQIRSKPENKALQEAEKLLPEALCRAAFPPWIGTTWDFYGASSIPGKGEIACGYFVAATLYAVGFNVKISLKDKNKRHYYLAGLPSEKIILKIVDPKSVRRFSNRPISEVEQAVKEMGLGVYLIGLDQHVAYLVWDGTGDVMAWHAKPGHQVTLEKPEDAPFISQSKYRIIGKLDHRSAKIWLKGTKL